jgi:hypothetical protein
MHKLVMIGLVATSLGLIEAAGPARAMAPASNAVLRGCLGMAENNEKCVNAGLCTGSVPAGIVSSCTNLNETSHCYIPSSVSGPGDNYTCVSSTGANCTTESSTPCITYTEGVCSVTENPLGQLEDYCDTSTTSNPQGNGTQTNCK